MSAGAACTQTKIVCGCKDASLCVFIFQQSEDFSRELIADRSSLKTGESLSLTPHSLKVSMLQLLFQYYSSVSVPYLLLLVSVSGCSYRL